MASLDSLELRRRACTCGPPPEQCVQDETYLTQQSWSPPDFRNKPRMERETAISMLIGEQWTVEDACKYVTGGRLMSQRKLAGAALRRTTAGKLREAGFAVVHTPGVIKDGPHVSVVWPGDDPLEYQAVPWTDEVSARFDACFAGNEEI
jgi:hypothetical protein